MFGSEGNGEKGEDGGHKERETLRPFANIMVCWESGRLRGAKAWWDQRSKSMWQFGGELKARGTDTSWVHAGVSVAGGGSCYFHPDCSASTASSAPTPSSSPLPPPSPGLSQKSASAALNSLWTLTSLLIWPWGQEVFGISCLCFNP